MFVDAAVVRPPMTPTSIALPTHEPAMVPSRGLSCLDTFSMSVAHLEMAVEQLKLTRAAQELQMYCTPELGPNLDDNPSLAQLPSPQRIPAGHPTLDTVHPTLYPYESLHVDSLQAQSILDLQAILSMTRDHEAFRDTGPALRMR